MPEGQRDPRLKRIMREAKQNGWDYINNVPIPQEITAYLIERGFGNKVWETLGFGLPTDDVGQFFKIYVYSKRKEEIPEILVKAFLGKPGEVIRLFRDYWIYAELLGLDNQQGLLRHF